ncbi:NUDIX hydrolase [Brachybacterium sp. DNPG3]
MPGGGVEFDESCEQAVVREVLEETGYTAELGALLAIDTRTSPRHEASGRPWRSVRAIYTARITGGTLGTLEVGGTTDRAEWIPLAELDQAGPRVDLVGAAIAAWRASAL